MALFGYSFLSSTKISKRLADRYHTFVYSVGYTIKWHLEPLETEEDLEVGIEVVDEVVIEADEEASEEADEVVVFAVVVFNLEDVEEEGGAAAIVEAVGAVVEGGEVQEVAEVASM